MTKYKYLAISPIWLLSIGALIAIIIICACSEQSVKDTPSIEQAPIAEEASAELDVYANPSSFTNIKKLKIGDPAPPLKIDKWYNTKPIKKFEKGNVYVIEFWASWCQPCRKSIPHLNQLQKEFKEDLIVIGIAAAETNGPNALENLLSAKKEEITYPIAYTQDQSTFKNYMWAANNTGLPWAFIVDRQGKIVWWGQPFYSQFEPTLRAVIKDTYLPKTKEIPTYANSEMMSKYWNIQEAFWSAYGDENWNKAIELGIQLQQTNNELFYYEMATVFEILFLYQNKRKEAVQFAQQLEEGLLKTIPEGLYAMAYAISEAEKLSEATLNYGVQLANKVVTLTLNENPSANILYAKLLCKSGRYKKARSILTAIKYEKGNEDLTKAITALNREIAAANIED